MLGFIAILLTMRLDEIAHFASLGAPLRALTLFTFYQVFYILPIALPLSCLIASFTLFYKLSKSHELTAMRACGLSLKTILTPILFVAAFLSLANFWIISELSTYSHLQTNLLKNELKSVNPLLILHNRQLMRLKGFYFDSFGPSRTGEFASDVILAFPNKKEKRLNLLLAKRLSATSTTFYGDKISFISSPKNEKKSTQKNGFDTLLIENIGKTTNRVKDFAALLQGKTWKINNDYLQMPLLLIRAKKQKEELLQAKILKIAHSDVKKLKEQLSRSLSEITKRISIALAVFSFTLLGTSFGLFVTRQPKKYSLFITIALTTFYLLLFFIARGVDHHYLLASFFYLFPHLVIVVAATFRLSQVAKGR